MMRLLLPHEIAVCWPHIAPLLAPAVEHDPCRQLSDTYRDLMNGDFALFAINSNSVNGIVVVEIAKPVFWIVYLGGKTFGMRPKALLNLFRTFVASFTEIARSMGCSEMRISGRNWLPILSDWEPVPYEIGAPEHEIRKAI